MNNEHPTPSSAVVRHLIIPLVASVPNFDKLAKKGEEHWCVENPLKLSFWLGCLLLSLMDSQGKFDSSTQCGHCQKIPRERKADAAGVWASMISFSWPVAQHTEAPAFSQILGIFQFAVGGESLASRILPPDSSMASGSSVDDQALLSCYNSSNFQTQS